MKTDIVTVATRTVSHNKEDGEQYLWGSLRRRTSKRSRKETSDPNGTQVERSGRRENCRRDHDTERGEHKKVYDKVPDR